MIRHLKHNILRTYKFPRNSDKMFKIYTKEVVGVIETWKESDFSTEKIEGVLGDIMYLTETAKIRLSPLTDRD